MQKECELEVAKLSSGYEKELLNATHAMKDKFAKERETMRRKLDDLEQRLREAIEEASALRGAEDKLGEALKKRKSLKEQLSKITETLHGTEEQLNDAHMRLRELSTHLEQQLEACASLERQKVNAEETASKMSEQHRYELEQLRGALRKKAEEDETRFNRAMSDTVENTRKYEGLEERFAAAMREAEAKGGELARAQQRIAQLEDEGERRSKEVFDREREAAELRTAMANKTRRMQLNLMRLRCVAKSGVERLRSEMQFVKRTC